MAYDGSVHINTKLNTKDVEKGRKELEKQIGSLQKRLDSLMHGDTVPKSLKAMQSELAAIEKEIRTVEKANDPLIRQFERAHEELDKMRGTGFSEADLSEQIKEIDRLREQLEPVDDRLQIIRDRASEVRQRMEAIKLDPSSSSEAQALTGEIEGLKRKLDDTGEGAEKVQRAFSGISKTATAIAGVATSAIRGLGRGLVAIARNGFRAARSILSIGRNSGRASRNVNFLGRRIMRLAAAVFVFNTIRRAMSGLQRDIGNILRTNNEFARSWNEIRVNMLTAFAPIWEIIQPAILTFMQLLAKFASMLAQFMATIFGRTYLQAREAAKALASQSEELENVGGAAKDAAKQLAGFDEINQLAADTAGGGGGADDSGLDFDITPPDFDWMDDFVDKLKSIFNEVDLEYWEGIGDKIGDSIIDALNKIPWDGIRSAAHNLSANLAAILNGIISPELGDILGSTLANALNTAVEFLATFAETLDWSDIGASIAASVNAFFRDFDFDRLADGINAWAKGILDMLITAVTDIDWVVIGERIATFLNNIEWREIFGRMGTFAASLINAFADVIGTFAKEFDFLEFGAGLAEGINNFFASTDWANLGQAASALIRGLLNMITTALRETDWMIIGNSIASFLLNIDWSGIFKDIGETLKEAFMALSMLFVGLWDGLFNEGALAAQAAADASMAAAWEQQLKQAQSTADATSTYWGAVEHLLIAAMDAAGEASLEIIRYSDEVSEGTRTMLDPFLDAADEARRALVEIFLEGRPVSETDTIAISGFIKDMADSAVDNLRRMKDAALENLAFIYGEEAMEFERRLSESNRFYEARIADIERERRSLEDNVRAASLALAEAGDADAETLARLQSDLEDARGAHELYSAGATESIATIRATMLDYEQQLRGEFGPQIGQDYWSMRDDVAGSFEDQFSQVEYFTDLMRETMVSEFQTGQALSLDSMRVMLDDLDWFTTSGIEMLVTDATEQASILQTRENDKHAIELDAAQRRESMLAEMYDEERNTLRAQADETIAAAREKNAAWLKEEENAHEARLKENSDALHAQIEALYNAYDEQKRLVDTHHEALGTMHSAAWKAETTALQDALSAQTEVAWEHYDSVYWDTVEANNRRQTELEQGWLREAGITEHAYAGFIKRSKEFNDESFAVMGAGADKTATAMTEGLAGGIKREQSTMIQEWLNANESMNTAVKTLWGINSPSTVTYEQGENIVHGMNNAFIWGKTVLATTVQTMMQSMTNMIQEMAPGFVQQFTNMFNAAMSKTESWANSMTQAVHSMCMQIAAMLGSLEPPVMISVPSPSQISIPRLARGGIVDSATIAMIGEKGKEAVMPLENNTQWMDALSDKIIDGFMEALTSAGGLGGSATTITLELDKREIGRTLPAILDEGKSKMGVRVQPRAILGGAT